MNANEPNTAAPQLMGEPIVNCDREAWIKARIETAMRMALAVHAQQRVGADADLYVSALEGIANGCAVEIIHTLGLEPVYVNLQRCAHRVNGDVPPPRSVVSSDPPTLIKDLVQNLEKACSSPVKAYAEVPKTYRRMPSLVPFEKLPTDEESLKKELEAAGVILKSVAWDKHRAELEAQRAEVSHSSLAQAVAAASKDCQQVPAPEMSPIEAGIKAKAARAAQSISHSKKKKKK